LLTITGSYGCFNIAQRKNNNCILNFVATRNQFKKGIKIINFTFFSKIAANKGDAGNGRGSVVATACARDGVRVGDDDEH
jgi:hypothetical protein